jgi:hypothetical protein
MGDSRNSNSKLKWLVRIEEKKPEQTSDSKSEQMPKLKRDPKTYSPEERVIFRRYNRFKARTEIACSF